MRFLIFIIVIGLLVLLAATVAYGQDATEARFRAGMEALAAAHAIENRDARDEKLDDAIAAFRAILVDRPELVRVRLELARAFFLKEEDRLARRHFEHALAGKPPPAVAANIRRFLNIMRARRRWTAHFGAAVAPDSNLNAASGERTIFLDTPFGRLPFTRRGDIAPKFRPRTLPLGRRRIPVSAQRRLAAALPGRCQHPRIQGRGFRPAFRSPSISARAG